ncbi:MAG: ATP-dependent endonuclease [Humibacter sp.]
MTVILVEGESDRIAIETFGRRLGLSLPPVVAVGGSKGARRGAEEFPGERLLGLVDVDQRADFERVLDRVFVCDPDLEGELIRSLGVPAVEAVIAGQRELESFRRMQHQPAQRDRPVEAQLARFFGGRSGNKARYAGLLAEAMPLGAVPTPIRNLLDAASE